ncbi:MAG TPA: TonB family protein [Thermoanaerobaculia bacterium]|jgi:TonB family protein
MLRSGGRFGRAFQVWGFVLLVGSAAFARSAAPAAPAVPWERIDAGLSQLAAGDGEAAEKELEAARKGDDSGLAEVLVQLTRAYVAFNHSGEPSMTRSRQANERLEAANKEFYHRSIPPAVLGDALARIRKLLKERPATQPAPVLLRPLLCNLRLLARDRATDGEPVLEHDGTSKDAGSLIPPKPVFAPLPPYTEAARESKTSGSAVLEVILDSEGCPASAKVLKTLPKRQSDQAVTTWKWWAYEPARYQGAAVGCKQTVTFSYAIQ